MKCESRDAEKLNYEKNSQWPPIVSLRFYCSLSGTRSIWIEPSDSYPLPKKTLVPKYLLPNLTRKLTFFVQNMKWYYNLGKNTISVKNRWFYLIHDFHRIFQWIDFDPPIIRKRFSQLFSMSFRLICFTFIADTLPFKMRIVLMSNYFTESFSQVDHSQRLSQS